MKLYLVFLRIKWGEKMMSTSITLDLEEISFKIFSLAPTITEKWIYEIKQKLGDHLHLQLDYAEQRTILIARSLLENMQEELQTWSVDMGNWLRSQKLSMSSILHIYQSYQNAFWSIVRPTLPYEALTKKDVLHLERQITQFMEDGLYWAVYYFEQLVNEELIEKEKTISYLHNDKFTAMGKLAASMAHELRNPLCAIEGFLKLILESTKEQEELETYIHVIMHEFENLHRQITGFLSFSKKPILDEIFRPVNLSKLLHDVKVLTTPRVIAENVTYEENIITCNFYGYEEGLKQVLVNLLYNAMDALQSKIDRKISISNTVSSTHIEINVENNGETIPVDLVDKMFQPFFTTKNDGTGIGLSICKNIIDKHNGAITCISNHDVTRFTIKLPFNENL